MKTNKTTTRKGRKENQIGEGSGSSGHHQGRKQILTELDKWIVSRWTVVLHPESPMNAPDRVRFLETMAPEQRAHELALMRLDLVLPTL